MENYEKKYKEALLAMKQRVEAGFIEECYAESIFPELKESEDKKWIPKEIAKYLKEKGGFRSCWIAWLEKQGKQNPVAKYKVGDTVYYDSFGRLVSFVIANIVEDGTDNPMYEDKDGNSVFQNDIVEQKPADKVEPKFHEGEWITNGDYTWKIIEVKPLDYILQSQDGNIVDDTISHVDEQFHSFTIEDAKDGDVLAYEDEISIYRHDIKNCTTKDTSFGGFLYHCCYDGKRFITDSLYSLTKENASDIYPATKEQRDLLFKKMHEAGYVWDADTKELKKIEQKPAEWKPQTGDTFRKKGTTSPTYHLCDKSEDGIHFGFVENREIGISGGEITAWDLKENYELVERLKPIEQVEEEFKKAIHTTQPKQEWSEEDETVLDNLIYALANDRIGNNRDEYVDWLKSLRPQKQWKPSDGQIKTLEYYMAVLTCNEHKEILFGLLEQLKKL